MDQHKEKEAGNKCQDSTAAEQRKEAAAALEESMDQRAGYNKAEEEPAPARGLLIKEVLASGGEVFSPALLAHPCSLLQLLFRVCAGCLSLHGYCSSDDPKAAASGAADSSSQEGEAGGDKANYLYMQAEVLARVRAARRPPPPTPGQRPKEGGGGSGGKHH